jgi:hypothetical protein
MENDIEAFMKEEYPDLSDSQIKILIYMYRVYEENPGHFPQSEEVSKETGVKLKLVEKDIMHLQLSAIYH